MTRIVVDNATIDVIADGSGDPIVLLHGFPFTRETWNEQRAALAKSHRVIALDLRGMGRSSVTDGPYLMETLAGDLAAVLDAMGVDRATIVGHSLGGYVALAFARMYSERVERLALVCSRLSEDSPETARARNDLADTLERENSIESAISAYFPRLFAPSTLQAKPEIIERARAIALTIDPRGAAAMMRGMAQRVASFDIAEELEMPVLVVAGAFDEVVPLEEARATAGAFPRAELHLMEASGHMPLLEEGAALSEALARFAKLG